jgi:FAD/FMN-containing dehydrogenase
MGLSSSDRWAGKSPSQARRLPQQVARPACRAQPSRWARPVSQRKRQARKRGFRRDHEHAARQMNFSSPNYARLRDVKAHYDPAGLFFIRHGVGNSVTVIP